MRKGVLLLAYGGPDNLDDVEPYYTAIRGGQKPTAKALEDLKDKYKKIGGGSPLLEITRAQARALQQQLGGAFAVYLGMRHWKPSIQEAIAEMIRDRVENALAIVLAPHYSRLSVGKYIEAVEKALAVHSRPITFCYIESWHKHPLFIGCLTEKLIDALKRFSQVERDQMATFFTAHSLPERIREWNDPYIEQLDETSVILANQLGLKLWEFAFQSAGKTPEPWLGPDLLTSIERAAKNHVKAVLVCPIGFICDHLEILHDIDVEAKSKAKTLGIRLERTESLNTTPLLIKTLVNLVRNHFNE